MYFFDKRQSIFPVATTKHCARIYYLIIRFFILVFQIENKIFGRLIICFFRAASNLDCTSA